MHNLLGFINIHSNRHVVFLKKCLRIGEKYKYIFAENKKSIFAENLSMRYFKTFWCVKIENKLFFSNALLKNPHIILIAFKSFLILFYAVS